MDVGLLPYLPLVHPNVCVIILNWNGRALLERFLPSVVASSYDNCDVVVADNASTDDSVAWLREHYPSVRIIEHPENWGFCRGYNEALMQTDGDYVVLLNNDVEVEPGWLEPLVEEMNRDPSLGSVQPKLLSAADRSRFEYAGGSGGHLDRLGFPFARGRVFFTLEEDQGQYDDTADIFWATGAAMMLRRSCLLVTGLLDERFGFHMEEIDLCWRMHRAGFAVRVVPASTVYHVGASSLSTSSPRKTFYNYRNSLLMLHKNLPAKGRGRVFAERLLFDLAAMLRFLLTGDASHAWAVLKAYSAFLRLKNVSPRVNAIPPTGHRTPTTSGQAPDPDYVGPNTGQLPSYNGSIVVDYFLRGRKRYSDLPRDRFNLGT